MATSTSRILLVDDDLILLQALPDAIRLRLPELQVDTCDTGLAALRKIEVEDYDAIVSDIKMPEMDGLMLMERIKTLRPHTPTILISGHGQYDLAVRALSNGAYAYLQKPIDREFFVAWLLRALQVRRLNRQVEAQQAALNAAQVGTWDWNMVTGEVRWSENLEAIHGRERGSFDGTLEGFLADVCPDDRASVQAAIQAAIEGTGEYQVEYRVVQKDGDLVWIEGKGRVFYDEQRRPIRMTGVCMDITSRKRAADASR
jgi:PAS domain S-box-containing protein